MADEFDKQYWDEHWQEPQPDRQHALPVNPHLISEIAALAPGTALDAGCGAGAEALWLAEQGWQVTAADIASDALTLAMAGAGSAAAAHGSAQGTVRWVEADLTTWQPETTYDLVATHYAHPTIGQLAFYRRLMGWVSVGGSLLIVGHRHTGHGVGHHNDQNAGGPSAHASVTAADITAALDAQQWKVVTAQERTRPVARPSGQSTTLDDVVIRAMRLT